MTESGRCLKAQTMDFAYTFTTRAGTGGDGDAV